MYQLSNFAQPTLWTIPTWWLTLTLTLRLWWRWRHSALRYALAWAVLALVWQSLFGLLELFCQVLLPARYFGLVLALCVPIAVLGARFPVASAWNFVTVSFLALASLPIFEQPWTSREWQLDGLRTLLLATVLGIGWVNYLPTRLAWTVSGLGWSAAWQLAALVLPERRSCMLSVADWCTLVGMWWATACAIGLFWRTNSAKMSVDGTLPDEQAPWLATQSVINHLWQEIRDGWGLAWAWRVREMVQAAAQHACLPGEFTWSGLSWPAAHPASALPSSGSADLVEDSPISTRANRPDVHFDRWWHIFEAVARRFAPPSYLATRPPLKSGTAHTPPVHQGNVNQIG